MKSQIFSKSKCELLIPTLSMGCLTGLSLMSLQHVVPGTEQTCKTVLPARGKQLAQCFPGPQVCSELGAAPDILKDCIFKISKTRKELVTSYDSFHPELLILLLDVLVVDVVNSTESGITWETGIWEHLWRGLSRLY